MIYRRNKENWEAMNTFMADAESYAHISMKSQGRIPPILFIHGSEGKVMIGPESMADEAAKEKFVTMARVVCLAHDADATVFVSEAWCKAAAPGEKLDLSKAPSQCPDRQEVLVMLGETRHKCRHRIVPLLRGGDGRFQGFGEDHKTDAEKIRGRFAEFVPPGFVKEETRKQAKAALRATGFVRETGKQRERWPGRERG